MHAHADPTSATPYPRRHQVYAHPVFEALETGVGAMVGGSIGKVVVAYDGGSWAMRLFTRSAYVAGVSLVAVMIPFFGGECCFGLACRKGPRPMASLQRLGACRPVYPPLAAAWQSPLHRSHVTHTLLRALRLPPLRRSRGR